VSAIGRGWMQGVADRTAYFLSTAEAFDRGIVPPDMVFNVTVEPWRAAPPAVQVRLCKGRVW